MSSKGAKLPRQKAQCRAVKSAKNEMKTARVKFMYGGKLLTVDAKCGDTKGLSDELLMLKLEGQISQKFEGAVIISISFQN